VLAAIGSVVSAAQVAITEYPNPTSGSGPIGIAVGPDGNLWFPEPGVNEIGRITLAGVITEFPAGDGPNFITSGPDGNLWFTEEPGSAIVKMTTSGVVLAVYPTSYYPAGITAGPDGNLWFTLPNTSQIGRITPNGVITWFGPTASTYPVHIVVGPDGNLWFTEEGYAPWVAAGYGAGVGRITSEGVITEFPLSTSGGAPYAIAVGPDGNLWFTEYAGSKLGKITPAGEITEFSLPTSVFSCTGGLAVYSDCNTVSGSEPAGIIGGPDGNVWFTELTAGKVGRITPAGVITEFPVPTSGSGPAGMTADSVGNLWFVERAGDVGKITLITAPFTITVLPPSETVYRGDIAAFLLKLQAARGFSGNVTLSCAGPAGSYCVDFPMTVRFDNGVALAVSGIFFRPNTPAGTYTVTFTGVSGALTDTATATFIVQSH
jgi:streptogramin lyase